MTTTTQLARIANYLFGRTSDALVAPTTFYVGLATGTVSTTGVITGEVSGGGYSRVAISNDKTMFTSATVDGTVRNKLDVTFPESQTAWGTITTVFISDVISGGTALYYVTISPTRTVQAFTTVYFKGDPTGNTGDISLTTSN